MQFPTLFAGWNLLRLVLPELMRFAAVVAPSYERTSGASRRMARLADVLAARLSEPDAGYQVEVVEARGRVGDRLAHLLDGRRSKGPVLVVVSGEVLLDEDGAPALHLTGDSWLPFSELRATLAAAEDQTLLVVDAGHESEDDDAAASVSLVAAIRDAMDPKQSGISLMVGARPLDEERTGPSTFISGLLASLEQCAASLAKSGQVDAQQVYETLRGDEDRFHRIPAAGWFRGRHEFPLLQQPSIVIGGSDSMPPSVRASARPPARGGPSIPPEELSPAADESWRAGNEAARAGRHQDAIDGYKKALLLLGKKPERADLYFRIGRAKLALGSEAEAVLNFDKALAIEPLHHEAFEQSARLLRRQKDFTALGRLRERRFDARTDLDAKVRELAAIAKMWLDEAGSAKLAIPTLERWRALREDAEVLELMVRALTDGERHAAANEARKQLAAMLEDQPARRARVLLAAARTALEHLPQGGDAVALARAALEVDPTALEALEVAAGLLGKKRRWAELAELYEVLLEHSADPIVSWDIAKKLGLLYRDELDDAQGAKRGFAAAVDKKPEDVELRFWLAELAEAERDARSAADHMRAAAEQAADRPDIFRRALFCFEKSGEADSAWNAAAVLDQMGEADINESLLADTHRPEGLIAARGTLSDTDWLLLRPEVDEPLERLLLALTPAAIRVRQREVEAAKSLPALGEATLQNPNGTTTLVRSMSWTARLLGVAPPALHLLPSVEGELSPLPLEQPTAAAGRAVGSGLDLAELAFLWGRVLSYFNTSHRLLVFYPGLSDVAKLLLAGLAVAGVDEPAEETEALADALGDELGDEGIEAVSDAAHDFRKRRVRSRVERYVRSVHACATRTGLLACGDVARAVALVERFPLRAEVPVERQIADVRSFSISRQYADVRERIGVAVRG